MAFGSATFLTAAALLRTALGFAFTLLAIKGVGAAGFGLYSLVMAYGVAILFSYSGSFPVITSRLVGTRGLPSGDQDGARRTLIGTAAWLVLPGMLLLIAAGSMGMVLIDAARVPPSVILACTLMVISQLITTLGAAVLEGLGRLRTSAASSLVSISLLVLALLGHVLFAKELLDLDVFLLWGALAYGLEALLMAAICAAVLPWRGRWSAGWSDVRELLAAGFSLQAAKIISLTIEPLNKSVLAAFVGPGSIAIYDLASKAAAGIQSVFSAYSRLFLQIDRDADEQRARSVELAARMSWAMFLYVATGALVILVLPVARGLGFDPSTMGVAFVLCVLFHWLIIVATPPYMSLIGYGEYGFILRNQTILAVSNAVCCLALVPWLGIVGAFVGALLATMLNVVLIERRFGQRLPGRRHALAIARPMAARLLSGLALLVAAGWALPRLVDSTQYWLVSTAIGLVLVFLILREPLVAALVGRRPTAVAGAERTPVTNFGAPRD